MKTIVSLTFLFLLFNSNAQNTIASTEYHDLYQITTVEVDINADIEKVWRLLTTTSEYKDWNTTVKSIEGNFDMYEKIKLVSTLAPRKTFKLTVKRLERPNLIVVGDKKGNRTYTITEKSGGIVHVKVEEMIGSKSYPKWKKYLPNFDESFDEFSRVLKAAAEIK